MENLDPATTGATAIIFAIVLALFEFLKRIWPGGDPKVVVDCPNKIHTLNQTLERMEHGIMLLEEAHKPIDGIEQWKRAQMQDALLQQLIDGIKESVVLQEKSLAMLSKIANRKTRRGEEEGVQPTRFIDEPSPG